MKVIGNKLQLILGLALLTQVGCSGKDPQFGQAIYPTVATQGMDHTVAGDAFASANGAGGGATTSGVPAWIAAAANQVAKNGYGDKVPGSQNQDQNLDKTKSVDIAKGGKEKAVGETFDIDLDGDPLWYTGCKELGGDPENVTPDSDQDGINDDCEERLSNKATAGAYYLPALDKNVFNGAIVSMKRFYKESWPLFGSDVVRRDGGWIDDRDALNSIRPTRKEENAFETKYHMSDLGEGVDSKFDRQIAKKFLARTILDPSDMAAFSNIFAIDQKQVKKKLGSEFRPFFPISDGFTLADRGNFQLKDLTASVDDPAPVGGVSTAGPPIWDKVIRPTFAMVRNSVDEMIPFPITAAGDTVSAFSGFAVNTNTLVDNEELVYGAAFYLVPPTTRKGIELRVGYLENERTSAVAGAKAGMFYVMAGNNTILLTTTMILNKNTGYDLRKSQGTIPNPTNNKCRSIPVVMAYLADSKDVLAEGKQAAMFAENVFVKEVKVEKKFNEATKKDEEKKTVVWKKLPQEWMRSTSLGVTANSCPDQPFFKDVVKKTAPNNPPPA
jgi:hypothetical protein